MVTTRSSEIAASAAASGALKRLSGELPGREGTGEVPR